MENVAMEEGIEKALSILEEDVELLQLSLLGAQASIGRLTLRALLRLSDELKQHLGDISSFYKA